MGMKYESPEAVVDLVKAFLLEVKSAIDNLEGMPPGTALAYAQVCLLAAAIEELARVRELLENGKLGTPPQSDAREG